jgi:hypothetical protein
LSLDVIERKHDKPVMKELSCVVGTVITSTIKFDPEAQK